MKRFVCLALTLAPALALADKTYDKSASHDCAKDPNVVINNGRGTYSFKGTCDKITVNGGQNTLVVENVKVLSLSGAQNTVTADGLDDLRLGGAQNTVAYKKTVGGGALKKSGSGVGNTVTQVK